MRKKEWFEEWFHTPYYHLLYAHRNEEEATQFIKRLCQRLTLPAHAHILDIPCGNGRHTYALHQHGFSVTGLDINASLIATARRYAPKGVHFEVHDLREVYQHRAFDLVCNLFTSLGYFSHPEDNLRAVRSMALALADKGTLVIDFLNAHKVRKTFVSHEEKILEDTYFHIQRSIQDSWIIKDIHVKPAQHPMLHFQERVMLLELKDFLQYFEQTGLTLLNTYGSYHFTPFTEDADRLILFASLVK